jgi:aminopeptidase N
MKHFSLRLLFTLLSPVIYAAASAQTHGSPEDGRGYRETPAKINDLVDTRLDVKFDYQKSYLYGKEWVTLNPIFMPPIHLGWMQKEWISTRLP